MTQKKIFSTYLPPADVEWKGVISIVHSGEKIPAEIAPFLIEDQKHLDQDVDYRVFDLINIEALNKSGVAVIISHIHRTAVDLNRKRDLALLNWKQNTQGIQIVKMEPTEQEKEELTQKYYDPYYNELESIIRKLQEANPGKIVPVIDLHSMPSAPTAFHLKQNPDQAQTRPDFCLSDLKGKSCELCFIKKVEDLFELLGHTARINDPYFGGHVTVFINERFAAQVNNIQIEIKRNIYMDEVKHELKSEEALKIKGSLMSVFAQIF